MNSNLTKEVHGAIKAYIDNIDDEKIEDRTLDKIGAIYKAFLSDLYVKVKPIFKESSEVKSGVSEINKKKPPKGSKQEKISFTKSIIDELISLFKHQDVLSGVIESYESVLQEVALIKNWNKYEQWIGWALDFGEDSYLATHIAKLTHSSSKGSSIDVRYYQPCYKYASQYLSTAEQPVLDTAYPDNKYSSISQLYNIEIGGRYIGDLLREDGERYLKIFTGNNELLGSWGDCFSKYIKNIDKRSYFLSKQTYFPVDGVGYHLLLPLKSSSLVQELHLKHKNYFEDEQKLARTQKANKKHSETITCTYPNKAYLHVTGSNHSNASSLNGKRGGRISLLSTMPPEWKSKLQFNTNMRSLFDKSLGFELKHEIDELNKYLLLIKSKSLSISEPKRNSAVINKLQSISDGLFDYVEKINNSMPSVNWSCDSSLPIEQQLLFEYWREDVSAIASKKNKQWEKTISKSYGRWLSRQLDKEGNLQLTPIHTALWADAFSIELREFIAIQEVIV
jgi:CRISPR-associated protein Csy1